MERSEGRDRRSLFGYDLKDYIENQTYHLRKHRNKSFRGSSFHGRTSRRDGPAHAERVCAPDKTWPMYLRSLWPIFRLTQRASRPDTFGWAVKAQSVVCDVL